MSKKNHAETVRSIVNALNEVKLATNYPNAVKIPLGTIFNKHKVNAIAIPVLRDMDIISHFKENGKQAAFKWNGGVATIDIALAEKVYDRIRKKQNVSKAESRFKNGQITQETYENLLKVNNGTAVEKITKVDHKKAKKLIPLLTEEKKVGPGGVVSTTKVLNPEVLKQAKPKFDKALGIIYGYKHLVQQPFFICRKPMTVIVDDMAVYDNVNVITFKLDGAHLSAKFHKELLLKDLFDNDMLELTKVGQINISNTLIGFTEADSGEKLSLKTVKVQDPYNIL